MNSAVEGTFVAMEGIVKRFPGVLALNKVDLDVKPGEIHALLGENGAGKSTLMNILSGLYSPDEGTVFIGGKESRFSSPKDAISLGIAMAHQHFMLVEVHTVWENMVLGLSGLPFVLSRKDIVQEMEVISKRYMLDVDPNSLIYQLSIGEQQRVEILKMLYRGARILIFDEPTSVLTPQESEYLFVTMRRMADEGKAVVFITHKLDEVMHVCDRVTVLRRGRKVATLDISDATKGILAEMMVGRKVVFQIHKKPVSPGKVVLRCEGLNVLGERGLLAVKNVSFELREKEIFGIAGVAGNGQTELCEALSGLRKIEGGVIKLIDDDLANKHPRAFIEKGMSFIPADRKGVGLVPSMSVKENAVLKDYWKQPFAKGYFLDWNEVDTFTKEIVEKYGIYPPRKDALVRVLSGGNLQKLILGRELAGNPVVIMAMHPTSGLDIGATLFVRQRLLEERDRGAAILLISEDLEELLAMSDRLAVIHSGELMGIIETVSDVDRQTLGLMMAGENLGR